MKINVCCFFFQAEDGIRDIGVTGVQTCALPIYNNNNNNLKFKLSIIIEYTYQLGFLLFHCFVRVLILIYMAVIAKCTNKNRS